MKKLIYMILICLIVLSACAGDVSTEPAEPVGQVQLANPWKNYDTLADAEHACGLTYPVPENVPAGYAVESHAVMSNRLLEITYRNGEREITVRMQSGDDPDISGVYETFLSTETTLQNGASVICKRAEDSIVYLVQVSGCSFSIYGTDLTADEACREILNHIC